MAGIDRTKLESNGESTNSGAENIPGQGGSNSETASQADASQRDIPSEPIISTAGSRTKTTNGVQEYLEELHIPLVIVLAVLTAALTFGGYLLRPATGGPPATQTLAPVLILSAYQGPTPTGQQPPVQYGARLNVDEALVQEGSFTYLEIRVSGSFPDSGPATWILHVDSASDPGYPKAVLPTLCPNETVEAFAQEPINGAPFNRTTANDYFGRQATRLPTWAAPGLGPGEMAIVGVRPGEVAAGTKAPLADIALCWSRSAPIQQQDQYLSAAIILVQVDSTVDPGGTGQVNVMVEPYDGIADYQVQSGTLPSASESGAWQWLNATGFEEYITATNIAENQADTYHAFLSGILFGVAGGALIGLLTELLEPVRFRRRAANDE